MQEPTFSLHKSKHTDLQQLIKLVNGFDEFAPVNVRYMFWVIVKVVLCSNQTHLLVFLFRNLIDLQRSTLVLVFSLEMLLILLCKKLF